MRLLLLPGCSLEQHQHPRNCDRGTQICPSSTTAEHGLDPDWVEAILFAWLARERLAGNAQDTRKITGARHRVLLGQICEPVETIR